MRDQSAFFVMLSRMPMLARVQKIDLLIKFPRMGGFQCVVICSGGGMVADG